MNFTELPIELVEKILLHMSYDEISKLREVNRYFDTTCQDLLNRGFLKTSLSISNYQKQLKYQLPRRESERRQHQLHRHSEILAALDTRISLLHMSIMKHVEAGHGCFMAGRLLDEINRIVALLQVTENPDRPHIMLQELRDISSMAMDHFEEIILPIYKAKNQSDHSDFLSLSHLDSGSLSGSPSLSFASSSARPCYSKLHLSPLAKLSASLSASRDHSECKSQLARMVKEEVEKVSKVQRSTIDTLSKTCSELRHSLNEMSLKNITLDRLFHEQSARIKRLEGCMNLPTPQSKSIMASELDSPHSTDILSVLNDRITKFGDCESNQIQVDSKIASSSVVECHSPHETAESTSSVLDSIRRRALKRKHIVNTCDKDDFLSYTKKTKDQ